MLTSKWHMNKMGLVDFWFYTNEEFEFENGHMLLRGSNGSGKSVTMQSFIPLLLDGNKSPSRLDAFGSKDRKIDGYLIGENDDRESRIGYLYLEFKREDSEVYTTIGMGLHARKNKPTDAWYFVVEDNRRVNIDFSLLDHGLALTKVQLKNILGNQVIDQQKQYMDKVNTTLFGFETRDAYDEVIKLLIRLRAPKLSNTLQPSLITTILNQSLQELSEDDLRPMSEAITNMDELKDQLDALRISESGAKNIAEIYKKYNEYNLYEKAAKYLEEKKKLDSYQKQEKDSNKELVVIHKQKDDAMKQIDEFNKQLVILEEEKSFLASNDMKQLLDDVTRHKQELEKNSTLYGMKEKTLSEKEDRESQLKTQISDSKNRKDTLLYDMNGMLRDMDTLNEGLDFEEHTSIRKHMEDNPNQLYEDAYATKRIKDEMKELQLGIDYYKQVDEVESMRVRYLDEREKLAYTKEQTQKEYDTHHTMLLEVQDELKENYSKWNTSNQVLKLDNDQMLEIFDKIRLFEVEDNYHEVQEMITTTYFQLNHSISTKKLNQQSLHKQMSETLMSIHEELQTWIDLEDPEPVLDEYEIKNRMNLTQSNIPFIPVWKLLEFSKEVSSEERNQWEELLERSGILNTLLVCNRYQDQVLNQSGGADTFLFIDSDIESLTSYTITNSDYTTTVQDLFHHFSLTSDIILESKFYQISNVIGTISNSVESKYIGKEARDKYQQMKIEELTQKYNELKEECNSVETKVEEYHKQLQTLSEEHKNCPSIGDLRSVKESLYQIGQKLTSITSQMNTYDIEIGKLQVKIVAIKKDISELADKLGISIQKEIFIDRYDNFLSYLESITQLLLLQKQYLSIYELYHSQYAQGQDILSDIDNLKYEMDTIQTSMDTLNSLINSKQKQLDDMGYEDMKNRLDEIQEQLSKIPNEIRILDREQGVYDTKLIQIQDLLESLKESLSLQAHHVEEANRLYMKEAELNYVYDKEKDMSDVELILHELKNDKMKTKEELNHELQEVFYANRGNLQEYDLSLISLFKEEMQAYRLDITARYKGAIIPFAELVLKLNEDIAQQSLLIEDSDRVLIEDILVNTISRKIRMHIRSSKEWVSLMNVFMNDMNTSSGLKLNLEWKSKKGENEEELDSEKLVEILQKDVNLLKESDRKKLSSHFRSKIASARKLASQSIVGESFHQVMKDIMDYRTWFEFRIMAQKTNEKKKELTNSEFNKYSGGEKAMSMYVPLFSAVAAKFMSCRDDAPVLIALDEAFAGVDNKNIANMFELIEKFEFDYIMNSQSLWGDYQTVKRLAIHELFRPENARFVTVISYVWNGIERKMVSQR